MRQRIKLTESSLHRIIKESVRRILNEGTEFQSDDPVEEFFHYQNKLDDEFKELGVLVLNKIPKNDPDRMVIERYISMLQNHLRNLQKQF